MGIWNYVTVAGLAVMAAGMTLDEPKDRSGNPKIVGGTKAPEDIAPYQVSIRNTGNKNHFCGGSIVGNRTILTAAHCVSALEPKDLYVVVGTTQLLRGGVSYQVVAKRAHELFNPKVIVNDIALLTLDRDIAFDDKSVKKIELSTDELKVGDQLLLTGWGTLSYQGSVPNDLRMIYLNTIDNKHCKRAHAQINEIFENQICTLNRYGQGACNGDSGGPLAFKGKLVGIVSWGYPCATARPDVFTKITAFKGWIMKYACKDISDNPEVDCSGNKNG